MHQDSNFTYTSSEDPSDPPQLPFPEPGYQAIPTRPKPTIPATPEASMEFDAPQLPFPGQQAYDSMQVPFPQPLPSTETIDTSEIRFLQLLPVDTEAGETDSVQVPFPQQSSLPRMEEIVRVPQAPQMPLPPQPSSSGIGNMAQPSPQIPFPSQPSHPGMNGMAQATPISQVSQASFPQQPPFSGAANEAINGVPPQTSSPNAQPYVQRPTSLAGNQAQMPGLIEIPYATQAMPIADMKAQENSQQPGNQDAKRAIIHGVISFAVSIFTLTTIAGLAAAIIGIFAITYGLTGLRRARRMPDRAGRGQAIIGIVLGLLAWCIVIAAFILRAPHSS